MHNLLTIALLILIGGACAHFANQRGRDPLTWFMLGLLLGFFGLILLFLLPPVTEEDKPSEAEYEFMDQNPETQPPQPNTLSSLHLKEWYYYDESKVRHGPINLEDLKKLWGSHALNENNFIWCEGMDSWQQISQVQDLMKLLL